MEKKSLIKMPTQEEQEILPDINSFKYEDLLKSLKNKEESQSLEIYEKLKTEINTNENKELQKDFKKIIEESDYTSYENYFNYKEYNTLYNAFITYNLYLFLDLQKENQNFWNEKFIKNKIWKNFLNDFIKNDFYFSDKINKINEIKGKNKSIFFFDSNI